jgi:hypothetical protein
MIEVATETPGQLWDRITILRIREPLLKDNTAKAACAAERLALEHAFTSLCIAASRHDLPEWMLRRKAHKLRAITAAVRDDESAERYKQQIAEVNGSMWRNEARRDELMHERHGYYQDLHALRERDLTEQKLNQRRHALIDALDRALLNQPKGEWKWVPCE